MWRLGIAREKIAVLEQWVQDSLRPDLTILLDLPVEIGLQRVELRSDQDRFEQEQLNFFDKVRTAYLDMVNKESQRFRIIDAAEKLENVQMQIKTVLDEVLQRWASIPGKILSGKPYLRG